MIRHYAKAEATLKLEEDFLQSFFSSFVLKALKGMNITALLFTTSLLCALPKPASAYPIPVASDYYMSPIVSFSEKLLLEFKFDAAQNLLSAQPDLIVINFGSYGSQLSAEINLYINGLFVDNQIYIGGGLFAIYKNAGSQYIGLPSKTISDAYFNGIISGSLNALLEIKPAFSNSSGVVAYGGWGPHAAKSLGPSELVDIFPAATIVRSDAVPLSSQVPTPATTALLGLGLVGIGAARRKQALSETSGVRA